MKKLFLSFLLQLIVASAFAYNFKVDGIYYDITSSSDLTCSVTCLYHSTSNSTAYKGDVVIPSTVTYNSKTYSVTSIGSSAFSYCSGLTSVNIPNSVTSIGSWAFYNCSSLTSVTIPNSVTSIGSSAFYNCKGLTSVTIPNSVTAIGSYAFDYCSGLTSVTIPNSVTSIGDYAFSSCSRLTSVTIPNSVTSIGSSAFEDCSRLTSVTIPNSVTLIGSSAFSSCSGLTSVKVDAGNSKYDSRNNCNAIIETESNTLITGCKNTIIPNSVTSIGSSAFSSCSGLTSVNIPNSVTSIGSSAFSSCSGLTSVTIPNSVKSIGDYAFRYCSGLTSVTIPNSVTSIGSYAFQNCSGLTSVTIPNSVTSIGSSAFQNCSGLTSVNITDLAAWCKISFGSYDANPCYYAHKLLLNGEEIKDLIIPNSVTSIGSYAFYSCSGLTSVTIPNSVTSIGSSAFYSCSGLTSVIWNAKACSSPSKESYSPFYNASNNITNFTIGEEVTSIPSYLLNGMKNLKTVVCLAKDVPSIDSNNSFGGSYNKSYVLVPAASLEKYKLAWNTVLNTATYTYLPYIASDIRAVDDINSTSYANLFSGKDKSKITSVALYGNIDASVTESVLKNGMNPNCLYYVMDGSPVCGDNIVNIETQRADNIVITDGYDFRNPMSFIANKATYTRKPAVWADGTSGWETICLPYEVSTFKASVKGYISPIVQGATGNFWLRQLVGASSDEVFFASTNNGVMAANTPYIVAFPGKSMGSNSLVGRTISFIGNNVRVSAYDEPCQVQCNGYAFIGNYDTTADDNDGWMLDATGGSFDYSETVGNQPFRAYINIVEDTAGAKSASLIIGTPDGATEAGLIETDDESSKIAKVYNTEGILLKESRYEDATKGLASGLYIINNKKVVVR